MDGGKSKSLFGETLKHGDDDQSLFRSVRFGFPPTGMPAFSTLSDAEVRSLVIYIRELRANVDGQNTSGRNFDVSRIELPAGVQKTEAESYRLEKVIGAIRAPYSFAFLPDGSILVTEKHDNALQIIEKGKMSEVCGIPLSHRDPDGLYTLLSLAVHPDYERNGWIYLSFGEEDTHGHPPDPANGELPAVTTIVRGRIKNNTWVDQQIIWRAPTEFYVVPSDYYAGRMVFDKKGHLFFSVGAADEIKIQAQDIDKPKGKIHRILDDGRIPTDNPFYNTQGAMKSVWSYGHRNPQGLAIDRKTGWLWSSEHGPRGGDELNLIESGKNYGWPVITFGMNYDGTPITALTAKEGMEQPVVQWTPSPAVSAITFCEGKAFPKWRHNLFVTSLKQETLYRLVIKGKEVVHRETILKDIGRLRDITIGPDGCIYLLVEIRSTKDPKASYIARLVPAK